jgi:hypothetical protein
MNTSALRTSLVGIVAARSASGGDWIGGVSASQSDAFCAAYTAAARKTGRGMLALTDEERQTLRALAPEVMFDRWTVADAARAALLLSAAETLDRSAFHSLAVGCFDRGDAREQESWMRAVALLPEAERFLPVVVDTCRTNIVPLFEAIACENPYPAKYFPERNFNQLVLKALFNSIGIARIVGLRERANPELSRMAADYAAERRAAGRSVPADIGLAS